MCRSARRSAGEERLRVLGRGSEEGRGPDPPFDPPTGVTDPLPPVPGDSVAAAEVLKISCDSLLAWGGAADHAAEDRLRHPSRQT